ncbi:MAG TPA: hypothetical protein VFX73_10785 [Chitinophagaceae bacterium]|nr:hypothetical protein [Chitinophagaceae bacterium]
MSKYLLSSLLVIILISACESASRNNTAKTEPVKEAAANNVDSSLTGQQPLSILDLPQSQDGEIILSEGYYEGDFRSYCLQPGTPDPSERDAYTQAPLGGYRKDIVETILRNSVDRTDLDQRNIQLLLWSVVSGSDYNKLSSSVKSTSRQLLTSKQIFALQGGVVGVMKTIAASLPETGISPALSSMKNLFELGNSSYEAYEQIAVLRQPSTIRKADYKKDQWYKQDGGYFVRYFPSGYQRTKIQVYVPKGTLDQDGKRSGSYLTFDPVTMMAIPANSNAQRLGIGAPVAVIIRKVIQINKSTPSPKKPPVTPPNPTPNPKGIVLN